MNPIVYSFLTQIIGPLVLIFFPIYTTFKLYPNDSSVALTVDLFGNQFAWILILSIVTWAFAWLLLTSRHHYGPKGESGVAQKYKALGELYYFSTLLIFFLGVSIYPNLPVLIYFNTEANIRALNIFGTVTCLYLFFHGNRTSADTKVDGEFPRIFQFYWGKELHPKLFGIDLKQLILPRLGMMLWQLLIIVYFLAGKDLNGNFDYGHLVSVILQSVYIYKTFHLESVLITMIDMTHDRGGFYLCWGSLVWMPAFYAFQSYHFVKNSTNISPIIALILGILGLLAIWLNYDVLKQKRKFRDGMKFGRNVKIWGKPASYLEVSFKGSNRKVETGYLLTSGWWGMARKMNYFWESVAILIWSIAGYNSGVESFYYLIFMVGLFIHRSFREDGKCREKYGKDWDLYCSVVPYRMFPYIF